MLPQSTASVSKGMPGKLFQITPFLSLFRTLAPQFHLYFDIIYFPTSHLSLLKTSDLKNRFLQPEKQVALERIILQPILFS